MATVKDGVVTAVAAGKATITAKAGEKSDDCAVVVSTAANTAPTLTSAYQQGTGTAEVNVGESYTLDLTKMFTDSDEAATLT